MNTIDTAVREAADEIRRRAETVAKENARLRQELAAAHEALYKASRVHAELALGVAGAEEERDALRERLQAAEARVKRHGGQEIPNDLRPVLALIETQTDLGRQQWCEVVYHDGNRWCSYADSETFSCAGDRVTAWVFAQEALASGDGEGR